MRVLVCGGRAYRNQERVFQVLDRIHDESHIELVIDGAAQGADEEASCWACAREVPNMRFPAHWATLKRAAGPLRNEWMLKYGSPDLVVAFPGGRGTANMVRLALDAGIAVENVTP